MNSQQLLPPFGRVLLAYQQESIRLDFSIYIFVGKEAKKHAYAHKKAGVLCTFLPYGEDFSSYRWPVGGQRIIVFDTGFTVKPILQKFCLHLIGAAAEIVYLWSESHSCQFFKGSSK